MQNKLKKEIKKKLMKQKVTESRNILNWRVCEIRVGPL